MVKASENIRIPSVPWRAPRGVFAHSRLVLIVVIALVGCRLALDPALKWYVNRTLGGIPGYQGHVDEIGVSLWRGAYQIKGVELTKTDGKIPVPFFSAQLVHHSVQWKELFHGALVGTIGLDQPKINFVEGPTKKESQTGIDGSWQTQVENLFPLKINHFEIKDGAVHFRNFQAEPAVDVYLDEVQAVARNLSNSRNQYKKLLANFRATGRVMHQGRLAIDIDFNPFETPSTFQTQAKLEGLDITKLNDFLLYYAGLRPKSGVISVYTEVASDHGTFQGYVKPIISDVQFINTKDEKLNLGQKVKSVFVQSLASILKNRKKDTIASKVPFSGKMDKSDVDVWTSIRYVFRNGFIEALKPRLDETISLNTIKKR